MTYKIKSNTVDLNSSERLQKEICHKGSLFEYEATVGKILNDIKDSNCRISCWDTNETSVTEQSKEGTHIRIGLKNVKKPINIIWDMLHEYGHHLSGMKDENDVTLFREELAWEYAAKELVKYPELLIHENDFNDYKNYCLTEYIRQHSRNL